MSGFVAGVKDFFVRNKIYIIGYIGTLILSIFFSPWSSETSGAKNEDMVLNICLHVLICGIYDIIQLFGYVLDNSYYAWWAMFLTPILFAYQKRIVERHLSTTDRTGLEKYIINYFIANTIAYISALIVSCILQAYEFIYPYIGKYFDEFNQLSIEANGFIMELFFFLIHLALLIALIKLMVGFVVYGVDLIFYIVVYALVIYAITSLIYFLIDTSVTRILIYPLIILITLIGFVICEFSVEKVSALLKPFVIKLLLLPIRFWWGIVKAITGISIPERYKDSESYMYSMSEVVEV